MYASGMTAPMGSGSPIGVFDSGIGGLSVLRHIRAHLPHEHLLYFADSGFAPYGGRPEEEIVARTLAIASFLMQRGAKALVVACNTATAASIKALREYYPVLPLVGVEPGEVARVRPGMEVNIAPVFGVGRQSIGRVTQVFGMINPQTQFVDVLVQLPDAALIPGTRVRTEIRIDQQTGWTVPRSAVLSDAQGSYIFQVHDGKAHRVNVKTGLEHGGLVLVQGAFASGEPVVSLGNYELRDGMAVRGSAQ